MWCSIWIWPGWVWNEHFSEWKSWSDISAPCSVFAMWLSRRCPPWTTTPPALRQKQSTLPYLAILRLSISLQSCAIMCNYYQLDTYIYNRLHIFTTEQNIQNGKLPSHAISTKWFKMMDFSKWYKLPFCRPQGLLNLHQFVVLSAKVVPGWRACAWTEDLDARDDGFEWESVSRTRSFWSKSKSFHYMEQSWVSGHRIWHQTMFGVGPVQWVWVQGPFAHVSSETCLLLMHGFLSVCSFSWV